MKKMILELIIRRTMHLLGGCVLISAILALLCILGALPDGSGMLFTGMLLGLAVYIAYNVKMMRRVYFLVRAKRIYFLINLSAHFVFGLINLCTYKIFSSYVFAWLFALTKVARYTNLNLSTPCAVTVFHALMTIAMLLAPMGMEWMYEYEERNAVDKSKIPGRLEVNPLEQKPDKEVETNEIQKETEENTLS